MSGVVTYDINGNEIDDFEPVVEINDNTTEWLGNHTPFRCKRCGHYSDTRTPYCAYCGKEAVSSANS